MINHGHAFARHEQQKKLFALSKNKKNQRKKKNPNLVPKRQPAFSVLEAQLLGIGPVPRQPSPTVDPDPRLPRSAFSADRALPEFETKSAAASSSSLSFLPFGCNTPTPGPLDQVIRIVSELVHPNPPPGLEIVLRQVFTPALLRLDRPPPPVEAEAGPLFSATLPSPQRITRTLTPVSPLPQHNLMHSRVHTPKFHAVETPKSQLPTPKRPHEFAWPAAEVKNDGVAMSDGQPEVFLLNRIADLVGPRESANELLYPDSSGFVDAAVSPGAFVALDLDETLIMTQGCPSALLNPEGVRCFQKFVQATGATYDQKNAACRRLQAALQAKVSVENDTTAAISQLQTRCAVFGLTARSPHMVDLTLRELGNVGLDFSHSSPFGSIRLADEELDILLAHGIIFCGTNNKGVVLDSFLGQLFGVYPFSPLSSSLSIPSNFQLPRRMPTEVVFVDNEYENALSVSRDTKIVRQLGIPLLSYHFAPSWLSEAIDVSQLDPEEQSQLVLHQCQEFFQTGRVLSNDEAWEALFGD